MFSGTPCIRLSRVVPGNAGAVYVKWESLSPHMSGYDRVAELWAQQVALPAQVFDAANAAWCISLAAACLRRGVTLNVFVPEGTPLEARQAMQLLKAKVTLTPASEGVWGAMARARQAGPLVQESHHALFAQAHRATADELRAHVEAEGGRIDALVCGASTGGLWTACAHMVRSAFPSAVCVAARVDGDALVPHLDAALAPQWVVVPAPEAKAMRTALATQEGMLLSAAQGAVVAAAVAQAVKVGQDARIFAVVGEGGERTLSVDAVSC